MTKPKPKAEIIELEGGQKLRNVNGVYIPENLDPGLFDDAPAEEAADIMEPALQGVLTELGERDDAAKVTVSRIVNENGVRKEPYLYECHPREFSMQELQEYYGAGDYRIRVYGLQKGTNYKVVHANKKLTIGASREQAKAKATPNLPVAAASPDVGKSITEALAPMLTAMVQTMQQLATGGGNSRKDIFAEMQMMAQIMKPAQSGNDPIQMLGLFKGLMDVMGPRNGAPEVDEKTGPYAVLMQAIQTFGDFVKQRQGANNAEELSAPGAAEIAQQLSQPVPAGAVALNPAPQRTGEDQMANFALKLQLGILLNAAMANADTETYSALIYEQAPDEAIEILQSEQWWEKLVTIDANFAPYKPWCEKVRNEVLESLREDAEPEQHAEQAPPPPKPPAAKV